MNKKEILSKCYVCGKQFKTSRACSTHIIQAHKEYHCKEKQAEYFRKHITPLILKYNLQDTWKYSITGKCGYCDKLTQLYNFYTGFKKYCSQECKSKNQYLITNKRKNTCLKKYKVTNYAKTQQCKNKVRETSLKKYGAKHYSKTQEYKDKSKETNLKKYGVEHYSKTEEYKIRIKVTNLKKYGVTSYSKTQECKDKIKATNLKRYGTEHHLKKMSKIAFDDFCSYLKDNNYEFIYNDENKTLCNQNNHYTLKHNKCNKMFTASYHSITQHYVKENKLEYMCPYCNPKQVSLKELELRNFIKGYYKGDIITNSRTILKDNQELDIYIPEYNFAIEFNGMYWHSEQAGKDKNYHLNKVVQCEKQDIHLMHIFEDEWDTKKAIIKYKILNKLHLIKKRIHARKCKVIAMTSKKEKELARKFLDIHHLQGRDNSSIYYGLMYENNIVSVMSFTKSRRNIFGDRSNNNNIELVRFASHLKYNIPGAASKLLIHFERDNPNASIISYAHRRLTNINNSLYQKLGFTLKKTSGPGYYYYDGVKRYHRYNFRKSILVRKGYDPNMTEFEITNNIGLLRIWDCGQLVYIKER